MAGIIVRVARDGIIYRGLVESYRANEHMNQIVLQHLDPGAWRAKLPGIKGRTIADIFAHVHNMRRKWLRLSAPHVKLAHVKLPLTLDRSRSTQEQASAALEESAARCCEMIAQALREPEAKFHRDGWAKPWPAEGSMVAYMVGYMIAHDAHHRGQVCMLAHQLGFPLPDKCTSAMWAWERF